MKTSLEVNIKNMCIDAGSIKSPSRRLDLKAKLQKNTQKQAFYPHIIFVFYNIVIDYRPE